MFNENFRTKNNFIETAMKFNIFVTMSNYFYVLIKLDKSSSFEKATKIQDLTLIAFANDT